MRYEVLGSLRVLDGDIPSEISARKIEKLFAALLACADRVVSFEALMAELWGEEPPRRAMACLQVYVSQLRKFLRRPDDTESPVVTRPSGYLLRLNDDELDARLFLRRMGQGRVFAKEKRHREACSAFEAALSLWRGPVMGGMRSGPIVDGFVTGLTEAKLESAAMLGESQLVLGMHREIVGRLYSLIAENPLREVFYRQLMLALYRSERQGDALKVYQAARKTLNDELGVEPCRSLRELHQSILDAEDRLAS
ncbi:AfsR/SARP family transcriptional regulator [Amycolatopsis alba]|uniref:Activator protein n=1 Tax=Amycolatopsis alba DSM 44262 TaxID=1125972 RepID=A0A229S9L0_AMYAL|nr:AfsR/SARP family transcriptional regulator [Amycolatopsis alba]OXM55617.1 activator protein [Amycolatopsis alba DSM 44262]